MKSEMISETCERDIRKARKLLKQLEDSRESAFEKAKRFFIIQESLLRIKQIR